MHYHHFCRFLAWNSNFIMKNLWSRKRKGLKLYKNKKVWSKNSPKIWSYFKVCIYHCVSIYSHHLYSILYLTSFKSIPLWPSHYVLLLFQYSCCPSCMPFQGLHNKIPNCPSVSSNLLPMNSIIRRTYGILHFHLSIKWGNDLAWGL